MTTVSHIPAWNARFRAGLIAGLTEAAIELTDILKEELGTDYPPASEDGEFPAKRTGALQDAVGYFVDEDAEPPESATGIRGDAESIPPGGPKPWEYMQHLTDAGRLGPLEAAIQNKDKTRAAFDRGFRRAYAGLEGSQ